MKFCANVILVLETLKQNELQFLGRLKKSSIQPHLTHEKTFMEFK